MELSKLIGFNYGIWSITSSDKSADDALGALEDEP